MNETNIKEEKEMEIDLLSLFSYLIGKWKTLLIAAIIGGVLALTYTMLQTPMYQSSSMLLILSRTSDTANNNATASTSDFQIGTQLIEDLSVIATSDAVMEEVAKAVQQQNHLTLTTSEITSMVNVKVQDNTRILEISATNADPEVAYTIAETMTTKTSEQMAEITQTNPATVIAQPKIADEPVDNGMTKNLAIGILLGLVLVGGIYTVKFLVNDRIQDEDDIEKYLEAGVLAVIPLDKELEQFSKNNKARDRKGSRHKR